MEKKQGFFSALKDEVLRGLSPASLRAKNPGERVWSSDSGLLQRKKRGDEHAALPGPLMGRSGSLRWMGDALSPLMEGPDPDDAGAIRRSRRSGSGIREWMKGQLFRVPSLSSSPACERSDLRLLLGVMAAPLAPVHVTSTDALPQLTIKNTPIETSTAQYILQQYTAASGGQKLLNSIHSSYAVGKVRMVASELETVTRAVKNPSAAAAGGAECGGFVLWQMNPDMWYVELSVGGSKVHAGCNGRLVWRHTPWLGAHTAKGPVRPLRRALQGLDPRTIAGIFADATSIGEKNVDGEECFVLKVSTAAAVLRARSEGATEIMRHVMFGYFSQRTGLLAQLEDSHLTRVQSGAGDAVYWETTVSSRVGEYRAVEGAAVAHAGRSVVTIFRFGDTAMSHTKTRMEEAWTIEEVAFNVPGLSVDCFIPPADLCM